MQILLRFVLVLLLAVSGAQAIAADDFYTDCEKFPNSLACMPAGEAPAPETVPSETRTLEIQSGPTFGGGGCPANLNVAIAGRSITVINMTRPCGWIVDFMKPLILLLAAISAVFIIMPTED